MQSRADATLTALRPVFLVGAARSGTSLLYKVLALHPSATWLSNWVQRYPSRVELAVLNSVPRVMRQRRARVWFGDRGDNAYVYGRCRPLRDRVFPMPAEAETVYARCGIPEVGLEPRPVDEVAAQRLRAAFTTVSGWERGRTLVSKRIANNRRIPWLLAAFPEARFVEILRDGRAVASSLAAVDWWEGSRVWWYGGTPADWRDEGRDPWELCARNWVEEVRALRTGLRLADPANVFSVSYEHLVRDPEGVIAEVAAFGGLDPSSRSWRGALADVRFPNQNERWRQTLGSEALDVVEAVQRPELETYGYVTARERRQ